MVLPASQPFRLSLEPENEPSQLERVPAKKRARKSYANYDFDKVRAQAGPSLATGRLDVQKDVAQKETPETIRRVPTWATAPPSPLTSSPQKITTTQSEPTRRFSLPPKTPPSAPIANRKTDVPKPPKKKKASDYQAKTSKASSQSSPSKKSKKRKQLEAPPPPPPVLDGPEEGDWENGGLVWSSSQPEIVIQATQQAEPYEGLQSEEDHRVMLESTPKRDKGKGKANAGIAGESATKHKDVVPEQFPLDTSDLPFEWQEDFADDAKELLPASPTYSPPEIPANISANSKRPSRQSLVTTAFHDAFLDDMPHSPPDTHTRKRKREKTPLFMSSSLTDEDEDEADSPFSRPDTRRSTNHQVLYSLGPSPEMPPPNQDSSTNRMGCLSRTPSEAHLSHRAVSVESDEVLYNSRVAEDYHKERIIVLVSPDGSPQSQSKSKRSQHSSPRVKTYSKRRPHVYAPGFPHALNPAQRLPLTPEPGWWQANVRSKRRRSTSLWPEPELAYVREPLSQIEPEQDEWHKIARPTRSRNCPWPEECKEDVPGSFDVASPEDEAERRPRVGMRRLTEVCDVKRCPGIPAWAQGEDVRMLERRRKGKGRASPPDGANGTSRPPRLELNLTRAESCQQHIEDYLKVIPRPKSAQRFKTKITRRQRRKKIQRDTDHIPERVLQRIHTMKFDEFRQRHKDNQISTRFLVNKELVKATERAQRDAAVGPMGRQRSMQRLGPRRALSPIREVPGRSGEGIVNYTPSTEWARRHHTSGPTRPRPRVPRIPQLTFTSRPSPLPDGAPLQQRSNTGNGVDIHQNRVETRNTSHLPSLDISRSASHAPQPVPSVEHIGPDLQEQRSRQVRVDPIPQEQMETAEARPKSEDHVDLSLIEDQPTEEDDQRLRATNQEFGDPINNDEFPSVPSDVRRAVDLISAVPQGTPEAAANALTGMTLTDHLMQMMEKAAVRPDRTSAPSLRQAKLDERARRVQMKRQIVNLSLDESDDALPAKYKQTSLKPVKIPDPQVTRSKTAVKSTPSRIGLNRSKSVGTESQVTAKQLKKRYESKTAAALIIPYQNPLQPAQAAFTSGQQMQMPSSAQEDQDIPEASQARSSRDYQVNDPPAMQGNKDPCRTSQARSSRSYRESATSTTQAQRDSSQSDQARSSRSRQEPAPPTTQAHTDSIQPTHSRSSRSHQAPDSSLVQVYQDPIKSSRSLSIRNHPELAPSPTQINLDPARPSSPGSWPTLSRKNPFSDEAQAQDLPGKAQSISPSPIRPPSALMRQFRLFIPANNTPTRTVSSPVLFHDPPQQTLPHSPPSLPARLDQGSNAQARDPFLTRSIKPHLSTTSHPLQEQHTPTAEPRRRSLTQPHLDLSSRTLHRQAEATEDLPQPFPIQQCGRNRARTLGARPHADSQGVFKQFKTPQSTPARSRLERSPSGEANVETHGEEAMEATSARRTRDEMMKEADAKARKKNVWVKRSF